MRGVLDLIPRETVNFIVAVALILIFGFLTVKLGYLLNINAQQMIKEMEGRIKTQINIGDEYNHNNETPLNENL